MSEEEHSEREFYYPDELVFNENFEENITNISSITRCQFQIFSGLIKIVQESHKRRRVIMESDNEDFNVLNSGFSIFS